MITLEQAQVIIDKLMPTLGLHIKSLTVCGSFRRKKRFINDIDIVMIERKNYDFGQLTLSERIVQLDPKGEIEAKALGKSGAGRFLNGDKIKRFKYDGIMIDLYLATEQNYSCLILIRTGSALHNIKLTTLAKSKGLKLFAGGEGLCKTSLNNGVELITETMENTEDGILSNLLTTIPKPEEREV